MAEWIPTPTDSLGMPLPIAPSADLLPVNDPEVANWHHLYHPRTDPILSTIGGQALRNSRLQLVDVWQHNRGTANYHTYFSGPPLPTDEKEQFRLCVLACAGYIPEKAIDLSSGEPEEVRLTEEQKQHFDVRGVPVELSSKQALRWRVRRGLLTMSNSEAKRLFLKDSQVQADLSYRHLTYRYEPIRAFFSHYVKKQSLTHITNRRIDQFLTTTDEEDKLRVGRFLLRNAAAVAGDSVRDQYVLLRRSQHLHPSMPLDVHELVYYKLGTQERRDELLPLLAEALANAA